MPTEIGNVIGGIKQARDDIADIIRDRGSYVAPNTKLNELVPYVRSLASQELEEGIVTPTLSGFTQYPSEGYVGFSKVTVRPIPNKRNDTDVTVDGAIVNIPFGYYSSPVQKSVEGGSATTPTDTIEATNTITVDANGLITATASGSKSITPTVSAGYVSSGTAGTVSVSGTGTKQLTKRTSSSLTASGLTVTAPAGYYHSKATKTLTDSNLVADNIKDGVTIFGVTGTHKGGLSPGTCNVTFDFDEILPVLGNKEIVISYTRDDGVGNILTVNTNTSFEALRKTPIFIYIPVSGVAEIYEAVEKMVHNNGNTYIYYADAEQKVLSFYLDD